MSLIYIVNNLFSVALFWKAMQSCSNFSFCARRYSNECHTPEGKYGTGGCMLTKVDLWKAEGVNVHIVHIESIANQRIVFRQCPHEFHCASELIA